MKSPTTYAEWASCCDRLLEGACGTIEWTSGVAERITRRIHDVFDKRLKLLAEQFQRDLDRAHGNETLLTNALLGIRKGLAPLVHLGSLPALPEMVSQSFKQSLQQYAARTQSSLEDSARSDRTGRLLSIIKRTPVSVPLDTISDARRSPQQTESQLGVERNIFRRVILK